MIKSWQHTELKLFYEMGSIAKINVQHADKLHDILQVLDVATAPEEMNLPGLKFHKLQGDLKGFYAATVRANWQVIFKFDGQDATLVDYQDYH